MNNDLEGSPGAVNEDPSGRGWFLKLKVKDASELDDLLTEEQYREFVESIS